MGDASISVSDEAKQRPDIYKCEDESYEDVILQLTERDKWAGFDVLSDTETDTQEGMENVREGLRERMSDDMRNGA